MFRQIATGKLAVCGSLIGGLLAWSLIMSLSLLRLRQLIQDVTQLQAQVQIIITSREAQQRAYQSDIDALSKNVSANESTIKQVQKAPPMESWQMNQNKEIRDRLKRLEQWRYESLK